MRRPQHASGDRESADSAVNVREAETSHPKKSRDDAVNKATPLDGDNSEFGGPLGAAALVLGLPLVVLYITACSENDWILTLSLTFPVDWYFDGRAFSLVLGWYALQAAIHMLPIGQLVQGIPLKDGQRLKYRCNGFIALCLSLTIFGVAIYLQLPVDAFVAQHLPQLATASIVIAFVTSVLLYISALLAPASALAPSASGNVVYDFYMGRELNPCIGTFDLKFFFELRPGLIGWVVINLCLMSVQCRQNGGLPSTALSLVTAFQLIYVADALWSEPAVLTTFDILQEGFGFMLAFGDLVWVPFLYSLQSRFLFSHPSEAVTNVYALVAIAALNLCGFLIFRAANNQKNEYRNNPDDPKLAKLESMPTPCSGKRLLVGGWWGVCRRPNYLGDLIMAVSWCLPCGMQYALPYFYPAYFFVLLVHRQRRDEAHCRERYGDAWDNYCRRVPYRIIPLVF